MKHPLFKHLGNDYPFNLEDKYDRILCRIEELWDHVSINDYFSELLIDKRGGRQGFPAKVLEDIIKLREFRELETLRKAEDKQDAINQLKSSGIDFNKQQFFQALNSGDKAKVDLFVRASFNVNVSDEDGVPALLIALKKGYTVVTQILLNAGADVNVKGKDGLTPLLIACGKPTHGYKTIAETLIKKGALINTRDMLGYTPLLLSLSGGIVEIAEILIERGADLTATTRNGESALSLATKLENPKIIDLISRKASQKL